MKKILINHTVELDLKDYERFCRINMIGNKDCHHMFRKNFVAAGTAVLIKTLQEV